MNPAIYILQYGSLEKLANPNLAGALGLHVTTGLIIYENKGIKKGMIIDPGMVSDWLEHQNKIKEFGLDPEKDITHILCTHFHQDHIQSLAKYPIGIQVFNFGSSSLLGTSEYGAKLYENGFIEIPEIKYFKISDAHTKKDTIYVIDSANEGVVAFIGDLMFSTFDTLSLEMQKNLDKDSSENPDRRFSEFKNWFESHPDVQGFYLGHENKKVSREEVEEYFYSYQP